MKVILKKELIDYPANDDMRASLCPFTKKLNNTFLSRFGASPLRDYLQAHQSWHDCILRLELDYNLKPSETKAAVDKIFADAADYEDYKAATVTEQIVRNEGGYVENNDTEVTGCRFTLIDANEDYPEISNDDRQAARDYFATVGYPEDARTPEVVAAFIERLRQDIPEIDTVVEIVDD